MLRCLVTIGICAGIMGSLLQDEFRIPIMTESGEENVMYVRNPYTASCQRIYGDYGEACKFYGECCQDPVRIREQLAPGTFECQNVGQTQGYLVVRCPDGTEEELQNLCTKTIEAGSGDLGISSWPVTAAHTGVTYRNMHCAICNGALHPITNTKLASLSDPQGRLEFWTMEILCDNNTVERIVEDESFYVTTEVLQDFIRENNCWKKLVPTFVGIHHENCGAYVAHCPEDYPEDDIKELCEKGPTNQLCMKTGDRFPCSEGSYKNLFCQKCWIGYEFHALKANSPRLDGTLLMSVRPITQLGEVTAEFSTDNFMVSSPCPHNFASLSNEDYLYFTKKIMDEDRYLRSEDDTKFWNLGSMLCRSNFSRVCGEFTVFPRGGECSAPGCGEGSVQDLYNNCTSINRYKYNPEMTFNRSFLWADSLLRINQNSCLTGRNITSCRCNPLCHYFGGCCFDAPHPFAGQNLSILLNQTAWTCFDIYKSKKGIAIIDSCPDSFAGNASQCTEGNNDRWDLMGWLVSDVNTRLTYKNIYCASCNQASSILFWDVALKCPSNSGHVTGSCEFQSYLAPRTDLFYPCDFGVTFISTCPDEFKQWKIYRDCQEKETMFVHYKTETFRNPYCAICNLGDIITLATMTPDSVIPVRMFAKSPTAPNIGQSDGFFQTIRFSFESLSCCSKCMGKTTEHCIKMQNLNETNWAVTAIPKLKECFNASSDGYCTVTMPEKGLSTNSMSFEYLCPGVSLSCSPIEPSFVFRLFYDDLEYYSYPNEEKVTAEDMFRKVVRLMVAITKKFRTFEKEETEFAVHDFVLIGCSLVSILLYFLYLMFVKRKALKTADKMMIALLISLFGALLCFSFIKTPAATDPFSCRVVAALNQFFFLASHTWSNSIAISVLKSIRTVSLHKQSKSQLPLYALYSFGFPFICVLTTYFLSISGIRTFTESVYETEALCFLGEAVIMYCLFLVPIYILIICNFAIGFVIMVKVRKSGNVRSSQNSNRSKRNMITCIKVSCSLGLGWILLFIADFHDGLWIIMQAFIELQGVLIVACNLVGWNCLNNLKRRFKQKSSSTTKPSSAQKRTAVVRIESIPM
ncbi:uncharacterized protein [Watersipora subatra]|uniref:uncharacterized protein isoform X2 n=1 Tax=Watersipora subatra TaxID=2589382 RepID=UPI00355B0569